MTNHYITGLAVVALAAIEIYALSLGIDGNMMVTMSGIIGAVAGASGLKAYERRK